MILARTTSLRYTHGMPHPTQIEPLAPRATSFLSGPAGWGCALLLLPAIAGCLSAFDGGGPGGPRRDGSADLGRAADTDTGPARDLELLQDTAIGIDLQPDIVEPPDARMEDAGSADAALPPPGPPACPATYAFCGDLRPGCWGGEECPACPMLGCDSPLVSPTAMEVLPQDCGGVRLHLLGGDPRLAVANVALRDELIPYAYRFDVLLAGRPEAWCTLEELPTGALRYAVHCYQNHAWISANVLEPGPRETCATACPQVVGCYELRSDGTVQPGMLPPIDVLWIFLEQSWCSLHALIELAPGALLTGWVEPDGTIDLWGEIPTGRIACFSIPQDGSYATISCTAHQNDGSDITATGTVARVDDARCGR